MTSQNDERLSMELELLHSIFPEQVVFIDKGRELNYTSEAGNLTLRLPDGYLQDSLPDVVSASAGKQDLRDEVKRRVQQRDVGEEVLDAIINDFIDLSKDSASDAATPQQYHNTAASDGTATIIVWLHHLLNTNKRKLALHPAASVSGITKPGYPGVLVYSGPAKDVHEHINELKSQNWQAFQSRLETEDEWLFKHGKGVVEVEAMKDIVAEIGDERKDEFMEAMRMK